MYVTYEVYGADDFFELVDDSAPQLVRQVMEEQLRYWVPRRGKPLPEALRAASAPRFGERIRGYLQVTDLGKVLGPGT
ncbi:hypothetical protein [Nocardia harenae]|uniref:hypothetical protein n=1 Tax=Nocardia harenae TaxID=358707 RepID=UPI0008350CC0|nr:hypothetical protein [Nocardia harenae]